MIFVGEQYVFYWYVIGVDCFNDFVVFDLQDMWVIGVLNDQYWVNDIFCVEEWGDGMVVFIVYGWVFYFIIQGFVEVFLLGWDVFQCVYLVGYIEDIDVDFEFFWMEGEGCCGDVIVIGFVDDVDLVISYLVE